MDKAWLNKKVSGFDGFDLKVTDDITRQIKKEISLLFEISKDEVLGNQNTLYFVKEEELSFGEEDFEIIPFEKGVKIKAKTSKGLLYGLYEIYRKSILGETISKSYKVIPDQSIRMINHWDNMDGSIERGYAGESIFFKDNNFRRDFKLIEEYARLLASVGINSVSINNVNVHKVETKLVTEHFFPELMMINQIFNRFGIKLFLSINFATPVRVGGLETSDPLDEEVIAFWKQTIEAIYEAIPSFGGFVVKADSEGEPGPFAYNRTHVDGANLFGKLLKEHNGICIWRCFVYNSKQDWRDRSTDRARAAYDHFLPYDGEFEDNVILQIKLGPLDFQVKEPVSPLFGALKKTNHIIEFQLTQEYTGQQRAIYYQVPVWKEALDFDTKQGKDHKYVKNVIKTHSIISKNSGICAVGVVGNDNNWTGHKLMQINLFAYGRLASNNELTAKELTKEWVALTFDLPDNKQEILCGILNSSRETYQLYNAPNGIGFMCRPNHHYGPDIDGYEFDRWGTYHFADRDGVGVDRTKNGTGFVTQYAPYNCELYNSVDTCPDDLLLWFHHVPYTHIMKNGKMLIQDIYDNHFEGVERVEQYLLQWNGFKEYLSEADFNNVHERLKEQLRVAIEWRDQINTYFYRKSGINDNQQRKIYQ